MKPQAQICAACNGPKSQKAFPKPENTFKTAKSFPKPLAFKTVEIAPVTAKSSRKSLPKTAKISDHIVAGIVRTPVDEIRKLKPQTNRIPQTISVQDRIVTQNRKPIEYRKCQAFRIEF